MMEFQRPGADGKRHMDMTSKPEYMVHIAKVGHSDLVLLS